MKYNFAIVKTVYDAHGAQLTAGPIANLQVCLPHDKPIGSPNGELILREKFGRFLERLTGAACPDNGLDVAYTVTDRYGARLTTVYSLV